MQAALLPDRGVIKVAGDDARKFLNGLVTCDMGKVSPAAARFGALLTPQGKIIADFIIAEAAEEDGGGFFLDCPRALARMLVEKLKNAFDVRLHATRLLFPVGPRNVRFERRHLEVVFDVDGKRVDYRAAFNSEVR